MRTLVTYRYTTKQEKCGGQTDPNPVETRIRELSQQITQDLLSQNDDRRTINQALLHEMLLEWGKLSEYYKRSCYKSKTPDDVDLEMSLFLVANYQKWRDKLHVYMASASRRGDQEEAEELDEASNTLEYEMDLILKAIRDWDIFGQ